MAVTEPEVRASDAVLKDLTGAAAKLHELRNTPADKRGDTFATDLRQASDEVIDLDRELSAVERIERSAMERMAWQSAVDAPPERRGPRAAFTDLADDGVGTLGDAVVSDERYKAIGENGNWRALNVNVRGNLVMGADGPEFRTLLDSAGGDNAALLRPVGQPTMLPQGMRRQRLFVRDLLSVQQTGLSSIPYIRELNPLTNELAATSVAEGASKPEAVAEFEQYDAIVRKLAVWIPATTEILADAPTLRGYIDNRLAYMLALAEEKQTLAGNGTAPNIKGIRTFSEIQTQATVADDLPAVIGLSIGKIENVEGDADGVVVNPLDYWTAAVERHSAQFDNGFGTGAPGQVPAISWGLPAVRSRALEQGKLLTGAWKLGATLFDRQQVTVDTSESHSTYFVENKVAIRAEERVALAVHRPDFFVLGTITFT